MSLRGAPYFQTGIVQRDPNGRVLICKNSLYVQMQVAKVFSQLQKNLQYWPQQASAAGDQTPRSRGFKAMFKASMLKIQATTAATSSDLQTSSSAPTSILQGDLSAAVSSLQATVQRQLPNIVQSPLGEIISFSPCAELKHFTRAAPGDNPWLHRSGQAQSD